MTDKAKERLEAAIRDINDSVVEGTARRVANVVDDDVSVFWDADDQSILFANDDVTILVARRPKE